MRVAVIGASGRSGQATAAHAVTAGHEVVSVVRTPERAPAHTTVAQAEARDVAALTAAVSGADAVVSCLGHVAGERSPTLLRDGARALAEAMDAAGVTRLVTISAAAPYVAGDDPLTRFVAKPLLERVLRDVNADNRAMERIVRASATRWTLLRPSRLVRGTGGPDYRSGVERAIRWRYSTRFDTVGRAAVDALTRPDWIGHAVFITD